MNCHFITFNSFLIFRIFFQVFSCLVGLRGGFVSVKTPAAGFRRFHKNLSLFILVKQISCKQVWENFTEKKGRRGRKLGNKTRKYPYGFEDSKFGSLALSGVRQLHYSYLTPYQPYCKIFSTTVITSNSLVSSSWPSKPGTDSRGPLQHTPTRCPAKGVRSWVAEAFIQLKTAITFSWQDNTHATLR